MPDDVDDSLQGVDVESYGGDHPEHRMEQYKLYLELTDRISQRRQTANTFFLAINTALIALLGVALPTDLDGLGTFWYSVVGVAGVVLCFTWRRLIRSYSDLNTAKFNVIHQIERYLPLKPYEAEWKAVGEGRDSSRYMPFTHIEKWIPVIFGILYLALAIASIVGFAI